MTLSVPSAPARGPSAAATGKVKLWHFLGRALRLGQVRGPSAAATCLTFKTPPAASLYAGIPQILFFWIYKIQSPFLRPGYSTGHPRTTVYGKCLSFAIYNV